jgi:mannose-6-phosphate isomerase
MGEFTSSSNCTCGYPLRLEPQFVERVWGSEHIEHIYPSRPAAPARVGEVWLTGDTNRVANGVYRGKSLREMASLCGVSLLGAIPDGNHPSGQLVFPLLVKFLFTTEKLSVQVHPPDAHAAKQDSWGKTEMWHILNAAPGARLAVGFRGDLPRELFSQPERLREAAETGAMEQMLNWQEVRAGETYFVPAGTVHAIGAGITLCEIQQNSDITYRLHDYNRPGTDGRPRPLHVEQALEVIDSQSWGAKTAPVLLPSQAGHRRLLAACPYFATERWEFSGAPELGAPELDAKVPRFTRDGSHAGQLEIWIAVEGTAEFDAGGERVTMRQGEVVIIPADAGSLCIIPSAPAVLLRTFPPDWERDVLTPLRAAGASTEQFGKVCFPQTAAGKGGTR